MGAFNVLHVPMKCPSCATCCQVEIQFRYGDTWQHHFKIGDQVPWGGNDVGNADANHVKVLAHSVSCPNCGFSGGAEIEIQDGRFIAARWLGEDGELAYIGSEGYIVLS
jgi:hypothetical protein